MGQHITVEPLGAGRAVGRRRDIAGHGIAADALVDDGMADGVLQRQSLRHDVLPAIMGIEGRAGPSVMESPKATMAVVGAVARTSTDFNHGIVLIRVLKAVPDSDAVKSPAPFSVVNDVTTAPLCWLAGTSAPGT